MKRGSFVSLLGAVAIAGCGGGGDTSMMMMNSCTTASTGSTLATVINKLVVPQQRADYAYDLNGDGKLDNQLGNIIGALSAQNLDTQMGVTDAVTMGNVILLLSEQSSDSTYQSDTCASTTAQIGNSVTTPPKYDGTDSFTVNTTLGSGTFLGPIKAGAFNSNSPVTATNPVNITVLLPLIAGATPVEMDITGAHIQYTEMANGLAMGQIHGAIKNENVQGKIIPNVAQLLTNKVSSGMGMMSTNQQILSIFDTGGTADTTGACQGTCKNPAGDWSGRMCAVKNDMQIDTCEVATNSIIKNVLAPDVQMFSDDGTTYKPNAANTHKDSLSLGLSFTAVKATITH
jgi:hypothetical protein